VTEEHGGRRARPVPHADVTSFGILFTAAGRRVSLLRHFRRTLEDLGLSGPVVAADASASAPANFVADRQVRVPRVSASNYIDCLVEECQRHEIRLLFPLIDTDLMRLAEAREAFARAGTTAVVAGPSTVGICADKRATFAFFSRHGIDTPAVFDEDAIARLAASDFPVIVKPYDGSSGIGVARATDRAGLEHHRRHVPNTIVQELVVGDEYTVDVLVGFDGTVRCAVPRRRIEVRAGEVSKGVTVKSRAIIDAARRVVETLPDPVGCITVQCFLQPDGRIRFTEINARFGGGFPLSLHAGADFPRWLIEEYLGRPIVAYREDWRDDLAMLRYDDEIIVDGHRLR
jgi:carbamoyl-phosphate synthase large subunit